MVVKVKKLRVLIGKNFKVRFRAWKSYYNNERDLPILLCVLFYIVERKQVESLARLRNVELPQQTIAKSTPGLSIIAYTPRCPALASLFQRAVELNLVSSAVGFNSIDRGYKFTNDSTHRSPLVVFKDLDSTSTEVPRRLTFEVATQREIPEHIYGNSIDYYEEKVSLTQLRVAHVFINFWKDENDTKTKVFELAIKKIFSFHSKQFLEDQMRGFVLARFLFLLFFALILAAATAAVQERELKLTEALRPMGISMDMNWLGWFITNFLMGCHLLLAATLLYSANMMPNILDHHASPLLLSGYMLLFLADFLTLAMVCSCFIKKARLARVYMTIIILIAMDLGNFLESSMNHKLFTYVSGVLIFGIGHFIVQYKIQDNKRRAVVTDLSNLLESTPDKAGGHSVLEGLLLLVLNSLFNVALLWYLEQVYMADRGSNKPFYFMCTKNYWCSKMEAERARQNSRPSVYSISEGIQIKNVLKVFGDTVAVDDVTLEVGENQITVILGHSGAGKTTLMSILAGFLQPTKGSVLFKGKDLVKNDIGCCPQHDILFPNLTCREQLVFYRKMCSPNSRVGEDEIYAVLNRLGMTDQAGKLPAQITQTERRNMSVACAIFSNSKVVILDEPSARVDPAVRDDLWNLIRNMRRGRTILMSTHDPYEAEVVGDMVAMLVKGRIKCYGAPSYLQNIYDPGYKLVVATETGDIGIITQVVLSHFPAAMCLGLHNFQVVYRLPDGDVSAMPDLLMELEAKKQSLGVTAYELHRTSLQDVLIRLSTPVKKLPFKKELEERTIQVSSSSTDFVAGTDYFTVWSFSSAARRNGLIIK